RPGPTLRVHGPPGEAGLEPAVGHEFRGPGPAGAAVVVADGDPDLVDVRGRARRVVVAVDVGGGARAVRVDGAGGAGAAAPGDRDGLRVARPRVDDPAGQRGDPALERRAHRHVGQRRGDVVHRDREGGPARDQEADVVQVDVEVAEVVLELEA